MNQIDTTKGVVRRLAVILGLALFLILIGGLNHFFAVKRYNEKERVITPESTTTEVMADIHARGMATDSWVKDNAFKDKNIYAKIYEITVTNDSGNTMPDWSLRINIKGECWINNAWNGTMEIHQTDNGREVRQTLDLRDYEEKDIKLTHRMAGQDLLIPLKSGDYVIYHPGTDAANAEIPIRSGKDLKGQVNSGMIFYGFDEDDVVDLSDYALTYHLHKSWWTGKVGKILAALLILWILIFLFAVVIFGLVLRFEARLSRKEQLLDDAVTLCGTLSDSKDPYHRGHSKSSAQLASRIAEALGMDRADCETVYYAAAMHNVGNYFISEQLLRKPEKLSADEFEMVKSHTTKGANLLEDLQSMPFAMKGALYHHERYDGTGYPFGLAGDEIPLVARIVSAADALDAMQCDRAQRPALSKEEIRREITEGRGTQFDPMIADVMLEIVEADEGED